MSYPSNVFPATFTGGAAGMWQVESLRAVSGEVLPGVTHVDVQPAHVSGNGAWSLRGVAGHLRYTERSEKQQLDLVTPALGRAEATCAALIPIRKNAAWWALTQNERRTIFEERSRHIAGTLQYLPRIARRLYHARDLGEPFDFLTWFELAPEHSSAFDELLGTLRGSEEWTFVEREVEIRLRR